MDANDFEVSVDVSVRHPYGGGNLQLRETFTLGHCDFGELADILHGFHELALSIRKAKSKAES